MAVHLHAALKYKNHPILSRSDFFRRKNGKIQTKRIRRKIKLRTKHIIMSFLLMVGIFLGIQRGYLFLISWERLSVREIQIVCEREHILSDIRRYFQNQSLGNILLLDIDHLQRQLTAHQWVRSVHIRKIFPSTIRIELQERVPSALLKEKSIQLIDKEGIRLASVNPEHLPSLPLLIDANHFQKDYNRKIQLAWACLDSLPTAERKRIAVLNLTEYKNVMLRFKESPTWLKLGHERFAEKIRLYRLNAALFKKYGPLEYIDFRSQGRLFLRPFPKQNRNNKLNSGKEDY